jgi:hypothetical protein
MLKPIYSVNYKSSLSSTYSSLNLNDYEGFNLAMGTKFFNSDMNLFSLRFIFNNINYSNDIINDEYQKNTDLIPGNYYNCENNNASDKNDVGIRNIWSKWPTKNFQHLNQVFIGVMTNARIFELQQIVIPIFGEYDEYNEKTIELSDCRILFISENDIFVNYLICSRSLLKNFILVTIYKNGLHADTLFNYKITFIKPPLNIKENISNNDINVVCYDINIEEENSNSKKLTLRFFKWFETNCLTSVIVPLSIPSDMLLLPENEEKYNEFTNNKLVGYNVLNNPYESTLNNCLIDGINTIKNNQLKGPYSKSAINDTLAFSFGTPFIDIGDNMCIGVGHAKIATEKSQGVSYSERITTIRNKITEFMRLMFGECYKEHRGSSSNCDLGYMYFSYFMLYNKTTNKLMIGDFFIPINIGKNYHFSLLFTTGIAMSNKTYKRSFYIKNGAYHPLDPSQNLKYIYISSGEGDYYNNIMLFNKHDIIDNCKYDAFSENFNVSNIKFLLMFNLMRIGYTDESVFNFQNFDKYFQTETISETTDINELFNLYKKYSSDKCIKVKDENDGKKNIYLKKYLKYKNKYLEIKKSQ